MVAELATTCGTKAEDIKVQLVGATWGSEITKKALTGLVVFLIAVVIFLSIYFEWRMAAAAMVALIHDVVITVGIYALVGFEVTPATVIGVLTILGFSLYDTVVVFDKVKENTKNITGQSKLTYSEAANLALNQTLVRSINTSIVALLPVAAILFVGVGLLGAGTLKDLALALFIGLLAARTPRSSSPPRSSASSRAPAADEGAALPRAGPPRQRQAGPFHPRGRGCGRRRCCVRSGRCRCGRRRGQSDGWHRLRRRRPDSHPRKERPHRQGGHRNQPKKQPRSKRS